MSEMLKETINGFRLLSVYGLSIRSHTIRPKQTEPPPWFEYCGKCYALVQLEQMARNRCDEQDCEEIIDDDHFLCRRHWQESREGKISECPECGEYKPSNFPLCRRCNAQAGNRPQRSSSQGEASGQRPSSGLTTRGGPMTTMTGRTIRRRRINDTGSTGKTTASATTAGTGIPTINSKWNT